MEILKEGVKRNTIELKSAIDKPKYKFIATCSICGCEFSYTKSDSYKEYAAPNYGGLIGRIVTCPCCRVQIVYGTGRKIKF